MKAISRTESFFREQLLYWHLHINTRSLPWKEETDPYKIWLSEIILQQTRAEQGLPYYQRFIRQYPEVSRLALASQEEVFRLWQGLGYYSRCKNLLRTARQIHSDYGGRFPDTYEELLNLPGVGVYTAAAIASFAFGLPRAVVDGNVYRILSRFFGIDLPVDTTDGRKYISALAARLLDPQHPAGYNQALMDFGAVVCKPKLPLCEGCPLSGHCIAFKKNMVSLLPVKSKRLPVKKRQFHYFILRHGRQWYIRERQDNDIWQHLFEFYLIETEDDVWESLLWKSLLPAATHQPEQVFEHRQRLTHQLIHSIFYSLKLRYKPALLNNSGIWVTQDEIKNFAFPQTIISFFNQNNYF